MHLGPYPMERIRRVARPTTLITDDIARVPKRADFFARARHGDLGKRPFEEVRRFVSKNPLSAAMGAVDATHHDVHTGEPAPTRAPLPDDPEAVSRHIKATCYFLDADVVGICEVPEYAWYSHDADGTPITPSHRYAIVLVIDQGFDTLEASSGDDWMSGAQSYRAYLKGSTIACTVAGYIRNLGYPATAHSNARGDVLHLPLLVLAGLGELSRIGELVLNPFIGPRYKTAVITTDLPLAPDQPIDFGLQDFCGKCRKCARECPCDAIPHGDKILYNGYEIWKPDVERCTKYRITNPYGSACGRCMKMCPFNKEGILAHRLALWMAMNLPFTRRALIWLDDAFRYGRRNPIKKWWLDLETVDGEVVRPRRTNQRDLDLGRRPPADPRLAIYPPETHPPGTTDAPVSVDRRRALEYGEEAARALKRLKRRDG